MSPYLFVVNNTEKTTRWLDFPRLYHITSIWWYICNWAKGSDKVLFVFVFSALIFVTPWQYEKLFVGNMIS